MRLRFEEWCGKKIDHMVPPGFQWMPLVNWTVVGVGVCSVVSMFRFFGRYGKARRGLKWVAQATGQTQGYMKQYYGTSLGESPWFSWTDEFSEQWMTVTEYIMAIQDGEVLQSFSWMMEGVMAPFVYLMATILMMTIFHYLHYYHETKSIYVMKRLPKRNEIHRRSFALPLTLVAACVAVIFLLTVIYFGWYHLWVPRRCIMPGQISHFLRDGIFTMWKGDGL